VELRPHLELAAKLMDTYAAEQPTTEFSAQARERFLVASGQRLAEAYDVDPTPSFFAAARVRFLMAAHKAFSGKEAAPAPRRLPLFGSAYRVLAGAGLALALMLGLSSYTVAEASDALPGDRLYGVKLQTERVRLALAFSEGAERDVRLDIAAERVEEIEQLTAKGRIIGPGVIERLQDETEPLAENLDSLDKGDKQRVRDIATKSKAALEDAEANVSPDAAPVLAEVHEFVEETAFKATLAIINDNGGDEPPPVLTPDVVLGTAEPTNTPEPTATPNASATPGGATATPQASATPAREGVVVGPTPVGVDIGVTWVRIAVDRFTTLIPSPQDGWSIAGVNPQLGTSTSPNLVSISNANGTQIITLNPRNGDMYWFVAVNGVFDEVRLREQRDGQTYVIDRELLTRLYGQLADVPLYILDHIEIAPPPPPPPTATPPAPTATP
jgi:hypothetical protein